MPFEGLKALSKTNHHLFPCLKLVSDWETKRQNLALLISDFDNLVVAYKQAHKVPYKGNPNIHLVDHIPRIRLASACESSTNTLYGMSDIAASFANKASSGVIPSSFNAFRKKYENGQLDEYAIREWIPDLTWYKRVREIRTEWAHHSSIFIGESRSEPVMSINNHRRVSDQVEIKDKITLTIPELKALLSNSFTVLDVFGDFIACKFIIPKLDLSKMVHLPPVDENGMLRMDNEGNIVGKGESLTMVDYLHKYCGYKVS